jgi:hypothetical protein
VKTLRAALCLAALAWSAAEAQTFNPLASYGTIWDTSPQLCVQGSNNFVCGTGLLVTGSIASYIFTTNGPANLAYLNPSTLVGNPNATYGQAVAITLGNGLTFTNGTLAASGGTGSFTTLTVSGNTSYTGAAPTVSACGGGTPAADAHATSSSGTISVGTGAVSSCTVTFASAYGSFNHCSVTPHQSIAAFAYSYTLSAITVTATSLTSDLFDYRCDGS